MPEFETMLKDLRTVFNSGKTKSLEWRRQQLEKVAIMIEENTELFTSTVRKDLGGGKIRGIGEMLSHTAAEHALANLDSWTADEAVPTPLELSPTRLSNSYIRHDPKGVVLIIAPWNYPIQLMFTPLVAAIAAGNCVVIKPSEVSGNCAGLIGDMVNKYLDTTCIKVVQGGVEETTALLKLEWDHIFFTGSTTVGKVVMKAAAEHLTPISLELGGKSPVVIDKSAKMKSVIHRISYAKWYNVGQTCIAPDYVLVHKSRYQEFVDEMKKDIARSFGENAQGASDWGRIINERHLGRIAGLVEQTKGEVLLGGPAKSDSGDRFFPPTLVKCTSLDEPLLREEIFGPVLPIITIDDTLDSIEIIRKVCEKPLALYVFAEDKKVQKQVCHFPLVPTPPVVVRSAHYTPPMPTDSGRDALWRRLHQLCHGPRCQHPPPVWRDRPEWHGYVAPALSLSLFPFEQLAPFTASVSHSSHRQGKRQVRLRGVHAQACGVQGGDAHQDGCDPAPLSCAGDAVQRLRGVPRHRRCSQAAQEAGPHLVLRAGGGGRRCGRRAHRCGRHRAVAADPGVRAFLCVKSVEARGVRTAFLRCRTISYHPPQLPSTPHALLTPRTLAPLSSCFSIRSVPPPPPFLLPLFFCFFSASFSLLSQRGLKEVGTLWWRVSAARCEDE